MHVGIFRLTYVSQCWTGRRIHGRVGRLWSFRPDHWRTGQLWSTSRHCPIGYGNFHFKWMELYVVYLGMFWLHLFVSSLGRIARVLSPEESHNLSSAETQQVVFSTSEPRPYSRASHGYHHAPRCGRDGSFSVPLFAHTHRQWRRAD